MNYKFSCLLALVLALSAPGFAQHSTCTYPNIVVPDGRLSYADAYFSANTSMYWGVYAQAGHSYSVELNYDYDDTFATGGPNLTVFRIYNNGDNFCSASSTLSWFPTYNMAPVMGGPLAPSYRGAFIAPTSGLYAVLATEGNNPGLFSFRIVDTTLFSPRWSTYGGFLTQWGFNNSSDADLSGVFTLFDTSGTAIKTVNVSLSAGKVKFYSSVHGDLNLPTNSAGSATFAFVGPPGAVQGDATILNSTATVLAPVKFEPRNPQF